MFYWLVIDLEVIIVEGGWFLEEMEIIEIGVILVVVVDVCELDYFQCFVWLVRWLLLIYFCCDFMYISQVNVDGVVYFNMVWEVFECWFVQYCL